MRIMKIIKEKNKFLRYFNETFKLNSGIERFIISILAILLFCHLVACIWNLIAEFSDNPETWLLRF